MSTVEPEARCSASPVDTSISDELDIDTEPPPTDSPDDDDTETSPSATTPTVPVVKPSSPLPPVDTCSASAALSDTRPLTRLALSPPNTAIDPPDDIITSCVESDTDSPEYTDRDSLLRTVASDAVSSSDVNKFSIADCDATDTAPPDASVTAPSLAIVVDWLDTAIVPPLTTSAPSVTITSTRPVDDALNDVADDTVTLALDDTCTDSDADTSRLPLDDTDTASEPTTNDSPDTTSNARDDATRTLPLSTARPRCRVTSSQPSNTPLPSDTARRTPRTSSCRAKRACRPSSEYEPLPS
jgi:hypothetical protein